jgi:CDP-diacylglycerol--glycerol-3-phosphate 3-phosphatidyltransferase
LTPAAASNQSAPAPTGQRRAPGPLVAAIPNALTLSRFPLAAVFAWGFLSPHFLPRCIALAAAIFAMVSDFADGAVARKLKVGTDFGKLLDPLADAAFFMTAFTVISVAGAVPWWLAIPFILREAVQHIWLRPAAMRLGVTMGAKTIGKVKVAFQCTSLLLVATLEAVRCWGIELQPWVDLRRMTAAFDLLNFIAVAATALVSVASLWPYIAHLRAIRLQSRP